MARKGGGARGRAGAPAPKSAPIHTPLKTGSPEWHDSKRAAFARQAAGKRAEHAAAKARSYPPVHSGGFTCTHCGHGDWHLHRVAAQHGGHHPTMAFKGCAQCGTMHATHLGVAKAEIEALDVTKDMDSSETSLHSQDLAGGLIGHRSNCPKGGSSPCGKAVEGRCGICKVMVQDHEALGKHHLGDTVNMLRKRAAQL